MSRANTVSRLEALVKSHIQAYLRRNKGGGLTTVREHEDSRTKKLAPGTEVYFRVAGGQRAKRGHVISAIDGGYHIQGKREAGKFTAPKYRIPHADVWSVEEQAAKKAPKSDKYEMLSSTKRTVSVQESNRRAEVGYKRLGMEERAIVTHPAVRDRRNATLKGLAAKNRIAPYKNGHIDPDLADMHQSYMAALIGALRLEASKAPQADLDAFREHLAGKRSNSRIFTTITIAGRNAALRFIVDRNTRTQELVDFQSGVGDEETPVDHLREFSVESTQAREFDDSQRNQMLSGYLRKLAPVAIEILRHKFVLDEDNTEIAAALNRQGIKYQNKYAWTRDNVGEALRAVLTGLAKMEGIDLLREFLKSVREHLTLLKARKSQSSYVA